MTFKVLLSCCCRCSPLTLLLLLVVWGSSNLVLGHVSLVFPPARKYDLDFLDNVRTKPPCGMPKGSIKTTLKAGTEFNVTWHLGYPHQGGYRLELLDSKENLIRDLTPPTGDQKFVLGDTTAQSFLISLPADQECLDCTVRLVRQALEWSEKYLFWSCSDVDIVHPGKFHETCNGHGRALAGRCRCDRLYYGEHCQYKDDCEEDKDCGRAGRGGRCVDVDATTAPRKQCFCEPGYFGDTCTKESTVKSGDIQEGLYTKKELAPNFQLLWRILTDLNEIEVVMRVKGTGYAAIGWRPKDADKSCRKWPEIVGPGGVGSTAAAATTESGNATHAVEQSHERHPKVEGEAAAAAAAAPAAGEDGGLSLELEEEGEAEPEGGKDHHTRNIKEEEDHHQEGTKTRVQKSIDVSIGYVRSSVSSAEKRRRRQAEGAALETAAGSPPATSSQVSHEEAPVPAPAPATHHPVAPLSESNPGSPDTATEETHLESIQVHTAKPQEIHDGENRAVHHAADNPEGRADVAAVPIAAPAAGHEVSHNPAQEILDVAHLEGHGPEDAAATAAAAASTPAPAAPPGTAAPAAPSAPAEDHHHEVLHPQHADAAPHEDSQHHHQQTESPKAPEIVEPGHEHHAAHGNETAIPHHHKEESENEEGHAEPEGHSKASGEGEAEPESHGKEEDKDEGHAEAEAEAEPSGTHADASTDYTPKGNLHAMDCTDMVIGMARGDTSRVFDYYTRDRSTPRRDDPFWGGHDDLTAAVGYERDGETTILFRKKIDPTGLSDHKIVNDDMHVIWAIGQEPKDFYHAPQSGLEVGPASLPDFYRADELKYHGKRNRGALKLNFHSDEVKQSIGADAGQTLDFCGGEWKYPRTCGGAGGPACEYLAKWQFDENTDKINFTVQTRNIGKWTGIGFSENGTMTQSDAVIGYVESSDRVIIMDMWITSYLSPVMDTSQDIADKFGSLEDGLVTIRFSRKRNTGDASQDLAFSDDKGLYMLFPVKGGDFNVANKKLRKHAQTPTASAERIFVKACRNADGSATFTTTPKPAQLTYEASIKFVDLGERYQLPVRGSKEYNELQTRISKALKDTPISQVQGFEDLTITNFKGTEKHFGEFVANLVVVVGKDAYDAKPANSKTMEETIRETFQKGSVGNLKVEPRSLNLKAAVTSSPSLESSSADDRGFLTSTKLYIVIACIAGLVFIAIVQALCTIYKMSKKSSPTQKEKLISQSAWKDYASNGHQQTNYAYETFEANEDHKQRAANPRAMQLPPPPPANGHGGGGRSNGNATRNGGGGGRGAPPVGADPSRNNYSLPRAGGGAGGGGYSNAPLGYGSYDRRGAGGANGNGGAPSSRPDYAPPDHYFMPSQRKYSGENIRVYVDYNK